MLNRIIKLRGGGALTTPKGKSLLTSKVQQIHNVTAKISFTTTTAASATTKAATTVCLWGLYTSHSYCDAMIQQQTIEQPPKSPPSLPIIPSSSFSKERQRTWSEFFQQIADKCQRAAILFSRWIFLLMTYSPAVLLSPMLLLDDVTYQQYWWKLFKICILTAGPCSVKFAQWISTRPDLFPTELCRQFEHLQSNDDLVPPWEEIEPVFRKHYGANWEGRLLELEKDPVTGKPVVIGGGCIAQVLRGRLLSEEHSNSKERSRGKRGSSSTASGAGKGQEKRVAIKVTHPGVKHSMVNDIELMRCVTTTLESLFPSLNQISLSDSVNEFSKLMLDQVDMQLEGENLQQLITNFEVQTGFDPSEGYLEGILQYVGRFLRKQHKKQHVHFPRPHMDLTNRDILVEDYEEGELIRDYITHCPEYQKKMIGQVGLDAIFKMIFLDNFIHADMHPGNIILANQDTESVELCFIDAGLVVSLNGDDRNNLIDLFKAIITNDGRMVGHLMVERSRRAVKVIDPEGFCKEMEAIIDDVYQRGMQLGKIGVSALLQKVLLLCYKHQVKLEPRFASVIIALGVVEGLGRKLDPTLDIITGVTPYVMRASVIANTPANILKAAD